MKDLVQQIIRDLEFDRYREIDAVNMSLLREIDRCPARVQHRKENPVEITDAMVRGSGIDCLVTEPAAFLERYTTAPRRMEELPGHFVETPDWWKAGRTKDERAWRTEQEMADRVIVKPGDWNGHGLKMNTAAGRSWRAYMEGAGVRVLGAADMARVKGAAGAVLAYPFAQVFVEKGETQLSLVWQDEEAGLWCKGRPDIYVPGDGVEPNLVVDLKSTQDVDPETMGAHAYRMKWHWQLAFYCDGLEAITGEPHDDAAIIAVEQEPPHRVEVFSLPLSVLEQGRAEYRAALSLYAECERRGEWPASTGRVQTLEFPAWATR